MTSSRNFYESIYRSQWRRDQLHEDRFAKMWYRALTDHCLPILSLAGRRVLEVGCGYGAMASRLSQLDAQFIGLDVALSAVSQLQKVKEPHCHAIVADGGYLPFAHASFDLVFCMEVLEHLPEVNVNELLDECFRVTKPKGHLIFSCPNYVNFFVVPKILAHFGVPFFRRYMGQQIIDRFTTFWSLRRLLEKRGKILVQRAVRLHPPLFEQLDYRLRPSNPLRKINDFIFWLEKKSGGRFPINMIGLHTLCVVKPL